MIYIGICDDETIHQIKNRDCCEQFFSGKNIDHSYIFFHSIFDVLSYSSHHISVLLLDIEMNDSINGVQLMHRLQHSRFVGSIIFISSHTNYVYDSFSPKTIGFCPKPIKIERLFPLLESSLRSHCSNHPVSFNSAPEGKIYPGDIIYIYSTGHYINVVTYSSGNHLFVMDIFPDCITCRFKNHAALDTGISHQFCFFYNICIPLGKVHIHGCNCLN